MIQVFHTEDHYILQDGDFTLWCSRTTGALEPKKGIDLCSAWNPVCIGMVYGVIGKVKVHPEAEWSLLLIRQRAHVGRIDRHDIYKIHKIAVIPLSGNDPGELDLELCRMHHFGIKKASLAEPDGSTGKQIQKKLKSIKIAASENIKPKNKESKDKDKFIKRIMEELVKMFNESDSFYFSETFDLTNSIHKQYSSSYSPKTFLWERVDKRFFWNYHMTKEIREMYLENEDPELWSHWILPVIQGYVQIEHCIMDFKGDKGMSDSTHTPEFGNTKYTAPLEYDIGIISRRNRNRAGTRSKKRGLEDTGACANYVETEQFLEFKPHIVSFVQVRGSIPVYWSQSGYKYRPPPRLDKGSKENYEAFTKHIEEQLYLYNSFVAINLAELSGKEKAISDAFLSNVLEYNSRDITYISFDFHEYCRGMKFENVSILTDGIKDIIKNMKYTWVDRKGVICEQNGVFRINCVDCLDRTNVVQTAIARIVMETQCRKLGLLPPEENLPHSCKRTFQQLWANNGDTISRQYAGTAALKGDYTRTGERKLSGMMKDGVNSANRYYLRFKDNFRQAAIDLTLGQPVAEDLLTGTTKIEEDTKDLVEREENLKLLVEDCKKMLIVEPEECLGGWSLIDADPVTGDPDRQEMDIILLLSQRAVYVAWYDDEEEGITCYQRIFLEDIEQIEIGAEPAIFKSKFVCLRLYYHHYTDEGFFHTFRTPSTRLFNNIVIAVKNKEEAKESLGAIYQGFAAATEEILSLKLPLIDVPKLDRKKTKPHIDVQYIHQQQQENSLSGIHIPRDVSAPDLAQMKQSSRKSPRSSLTPSPVEPSSPSESPSRTRRNIMSDLKKNINTGLKNITKLNIPGIRLGRNAPDDRTTMDDSSVFYKQEKQAGGDQLNRTDSSENVTLKFKVSENVAPSERKLKGDNFNENAESNLQHFTKDAPNASESSENFDDEDGGNMSHTLGKSQEDDSKSSSNMNNPIEVSSHDNEPTQTSKIPKIIFPATNSTKTQRIAESLEQEMRQKLGDRKCYTQVIFL
ncbi:phosphatidylinositide phosphatase SAC2-like [Mytilus trossulus]|uniref:phosphatidylinositide phosphatase SAC2-like n=1 Tax=Mytilus trossulus TaxID=6551 RepID=UPI003007DFAE